MKRCPACNAVYPDQLRFCGADGSPLVEAETTDPLLGAVIAETYRLCECMGEGGFGRVYRATHERLPMTVAVKILAAARALDPDMVSRFRLEVEAEALLVHPNIVRVLDHGLDERAGYYIAMEFLEGQDLGKILDSGKRLGILELFAVMEQAISALALAHRHGIIHRDVKAENLFLVVDKTRPEGFILKLLDFGLARLARPATSARGHTLRRGTHESRASRVLGSPATIAPETATGQAIDHRADIYSLGAVFFELLTQQVLFAANSVAEMMHRIVHMPAEAPSAVPGGQWVPPELDDLVLSMLAKDPAQRPQTMAEVARRLERVRPATEAAWARWFLPGGEGMGRTPTLRSVATLPHLARSPQSAKRPLPLVLVVDDDKVMRGLVRSLVLSSGCDCETVDSAEAALEWLRGHPPPDALMTDLLMPGVDGVTLADTVRKHGYDGALIFCTSVASEQVRSDAARLRDAWCLDKATELFRVPEVLRAAGIAPQLRP